jgi:hypothetical protein
MTYPPSQSHSETSVESSRTLSRKRLVSQERRVYECLRIGGRADWELWELVRNGGLFDKISSMRRARIGLLWRSRKLKATPWHPIEDSGQRNRDPMSNKRTVIWQFKNGYKDIPYEEWAREYRRLARGVTEDLPE